MQPRIATPIRPPLAIAATAIVIVALLLVGRAAGPARPEDTISADQAVVIAREFAVAGQASNEDVRQVRTGTVTQVGYAWQVQVDLFVVWGPPDGASPDPSASPIWIYYLIDVDRRTGLPSIFAQG
jgi:hypothetical protein